jgi:hypothetical protein
MSSDVIVAGDGLFPPQANATSSVVGGAMTNARDPGDGVFTYRQMHSLPTSVPALRARIEQAVSAQTERNVNANVPPGKHHREIVARLRPRYFRGPQGIPSLALIAISDLGASPIPPRLRTALFRTATTIPGVHATAARDRLGRSGVAVFTYGTRLIFDRRTGSMLAGVSGTIVAHGAVNSIGALPDRLAPIPEPAGLEPPRLSVFPSWGGQRTVFTIRFPAPTGTRRGDRAPHLWTSMFGPTGPGCYFWTSRPPNVSVAPGSVHTAAGSPEYVYRLSASVLDRRAWCPGRYQVIITPIQPSQEAAGGVRRLPPSSAAVYFNVR